MFRGATENGANCIPIFIGTNTDAAYLTATVSSGFSVLNVCIKIILTPLPLSPRTIITYLSHQNPYKKRYPLYTHFHRYKY